MNDGAGNSWQGGPWLEADQLVDDVELKAGGVLRTSTRPTTNPRSQKPSPRVCMSIHPKGELCGHGAHAMWVGVVVVKDPGARGGSTRGLRSVRRWRRRGGRWWRECRRGRGRGRWRRRGWRRAAACRREPRYTGGKQSAEQQDRLWWRHAAPCRRDPRVH